MAGDALLHGIGAVLSYVLPDGSEKPVAYVLRALLLNERQYAQLEKEALPLVYWIQKFHQYIYGRNFTLLTDHHPFTVILGPKKGIDHLQQHVCRGGHYFYRRISPLLSFTVHKTMQMLMVYPDCQ